jgi:hypothetical protein
MLVLRKKKKPNPDPKIADNKAKFAHLTKVFHGFSCHLRPFHYKRQFLGEIVEIATAVADIRQSNGSANIFTYSRDMLEEINPVTEWARHKSDLLRRHFAMLAGIRGELDESWAKHSSKIMIICWYSFMGVGCLPVVQVSYLSVSWL